MNPEEVSPQASAALTRALDAGHATVYVSGGVGRVEFTEDGFQAWYLAETAAVRAKVAADLEAAVDQYPTTIWPEPTGEDDLPDRFSASAARTAYRNAARIARGEQPC